VDTGPPTLDISRALVGGSLHCDWLDATRTMAGPGWGGVARPWVFSSSSSQTSTSIVGAEDDDGVVDLTKGELPPPPFEMQPSQQALDAIADLAAPLAPPEPPHAGATIAGNAGAARSERTSPRRRLPPTLSSPGAAVGGSKRPAPDDDIVGGTSANAPPPPPVVKVEPLAAQPTHARPQHRPEPAKRASNSRQCEAVDQRHASDARAPPPPKSPSDDRPPLTAAQRELISQVQLVLTEAPASVIEELVRTQVPELQTVEGVITHLLDQDHADIIAVTPPPAAAAAGSAASANRPAAPVPVVIDADASPGPAKRRRTDPTSDVVRVGRSAADAVIVSIAS